jgi:hypothetical protein
VSLVCRDISQRGRVLSMKRSLYFDLESTDRHHLSWHEGLARSVVDPFLTSIHDVIALI